MKSFTCAALIAASSLMGISVSASEIVFDAKIDASLLFDYTSQSFSLYDAYGYSDAATFEADYPVFALTDDYEINGYGELDYFINAFSVSPSFSAGETYRWDISIDFDYQYGFETSNGAPMDYGDSGSFAFSEDFTADELSQLAFGSSAAEVAYALSMLPASGTFGNALDLVTYFASGIVDVPTGLTLTDDQIKYYGDFSAPSGYLDIAVDSPIAGLESMYADGYASLSLTATRTGGAPSSSVPDSGSTGLLACLGLGVLAFARNRFGSPSK